MFLREIQCCDLLSRSSYFHLLLVQHLPLDVHGFVYSFCVCTAVGGIHTMTLLIVRSSWLSYSMRHWYSLCFQPVFTALSVKLSICIFAP